VQQLKKTISQQQVKNFPLETRSAARKKKLAAGVSNAADPLIMFPTISSSGPLPSEHNHEKHVMSVNKKEEMLHELIRTKGSVDGVYERLSNNIPIIESVIDDMRDQLCFMQAMGKVIITKEDAITGLIQENEELRSKLKALEERISNQKCIISDEKKKFDLLEEEKSKSVSCMLKMLEDLRDQMNEFLKSHKDDSSLLPEDRESRTTEDSTVGDHVHLYDHEKSSQAPICFSIRTIPLSFNIHTVV
jgi:hypothetical protein